MKTYLFDILPKIKRFSKRLDDKTILQGKSWMAINEDNTVKTVYIFSENNNLVVSNSGKAEVGKWTFLNADSILLQLDQGAYLMKHGFLDDEFLILNLDGTDEFALFINETKLGQQIKSINEVSKYLAKRYKTNSAPVFQESKYLNQEHPLGAFFIKYSPKTLEVIGRFSIRELIHLKEKNKFYGHDRFECVKNRKTYTLNQILYYEESQNN